MTMVCWCTSIYDRNRANWWLFKLRTVSALTEMEPRDVCLAKNGRLFDIIYGQDNSVSIVGVYDTILDCESDKDSNRYSSHRPVSMAYSSS